MFKKSAAPSAGGYTIAKSLRFRSSASAYMNRTPASASNRQKFTWSAWVKRGIIGTTQYPFEVGSTSTDYSGIAFANDNLYFVNQVSSSLTINVSTAAVYRDPSSWYHIVIGIDTTQATNSNGVKIWINGAQATLNYTTYTQNTNCQINNTIEHDLGRTNFGGAGNYFDGYMAEVNFVDGQQLNASSFGSTNSLTGVWQPAKYTGSYGTNGYYLPFTNTTSTTTLGYDSSGNGNNWTTNNISLTAGSTYDSMTDVPTLTSATAANYCVGNPLNAVATYSNGNLTLTNNSGGNWYGGSSTMALPTTGKWYWEVTPTVIGSSGVMIGIAPITQSFQSTGTFPGSTATSYGYYSFNGYLYNNASGAAYGATYVANNVIGVAFDAGAGTLTFYKNNTSQGTAASSLTGTYTPALAAYDSSASLSANFGQQPFAYTPPSGFVALNTYNLPDSTIVAGNKVMDATTYTGNGTSQSVVNAAGFKPDLVWLKTRNVGNGHILEDSVRGALQYLASELTAAESTLAGSVTSFNSNGFSVGSQGGSNGSGNSQIGWQWQAGQGSTSSNTSGSITSTVSVNASAGFSVVTYTGNGSNATVGHGLGVAPQFIIVKNRATVSNWNCYHVSIGNGNALSLNTTGASSASGQYWNSTTPTSTVFSLGTSGETNGSGNATVAYCWSEIAGFSKFGSYTGNGSADGPFIYTGFRPKYVLWKNTSTGADGWYCYDSVRQTYNSETTYLSPNVSNAEGSNGGPMDFLSNGFKVRNTGTDMNTNGNTYIYASWAENPFKNALAR